jgi:DNA-binding NarL/FixJ family response regulator
MHINVTITDDHPMVINGLQNMIATYDHIDVISTYETGKALMDGLVASQPDVLLLDICLPDLQGDEIAGLISKKYPDIRILALTSMDATYYVTNMIQHGCLGYLLKKTSQQTLVAAIEDVYAGKQFIDLSLKDQVLQHMLKVRKNSNGRSAPLTRREKEILQLIAAGYTNPEIASKLFLSLRTIKNHRFNLLQKLDVKNTAMLIRKAISLGLTEK